MLLTLTTTHEPATDLGYLLHKNPVRMQTESKFGECLGNLAPNDYTWCDLFWEQRVVSSNLTAPTNTIHYRVEGIRTSIHGAVKFELSLRPSLVE